MSVKDDATGIKTEFTKVSKLNNSISPLKTAEWGLGVEGVWLDQARENPSQARPGDVLSLQQKTGNHYVQRIIEEQGAAVATDHKGNLNTYISNEIKRAMAGGQPMGGTVQREMGESFGHDFSSVRVHTDNRANHLSNQINARAFTLGNNIFFRSGAYNPSTSQGKNTLKHELTHVIQQGGKNPGNGPLVLGDADTSHEREAKKVAASNSVSIKPAQAGVQRQLLNTALSSGRSLSGNVVQRFMDGFKNKMKSVFSRGGTTTTPTTTPTTTTLPTTTTTTPTTTTPTTTTTTTATPAPVNPPPTGLSQEEWEKVQGLGAKTHTDWNKLSEEQKDFIKNNLDSGIAYLQVLVMAGMANTWPKDDANDYIFDTAILNFIHEDSKLWFKTWNTKISAGQKTCLLTNYASDKPLFAGLAGAAAEGAWPKDGADADIVDIATIKFIKNILNSAYVKWNKVKKEHRSMVLLAKADGDDLAKELFRASLSDNWPKSRTNADMSAYADWKRLKEALSSLTPAQWNGYDDAVRAMALDAADAEKKKKILNQAQYQINKKNSEDTKLEKFASNPITGGVIGAGGLTGDILGTSDDHLKASGTVGAVANAADIGVQGVSIFSGIRNWARGNQMAKANTSRAATSLGKKQASKGKWGLASGVLGMGGAVSGLVGNVSKAHDPDADKASGTSATAGDVGGAFGIAGGTLGGALSAKSFFGAFGRSKRAKSYINEKTTATAEEQKLSGIAQFTSNNQNRFGKLMGIGRGLAGITSGIASIVGNSTFSAIASGINLGLGLGQAGYEKATQAKEGDVEQKAQDLIDLLKSGTAAATQAAKFAHDVLKISDIDPNASPDTWKAWVEEDEAAAKDLIKSKIAKNQ